MATNVSSITKDIQRIVGVNPDGVYGPATAAAILSALQSSYKLTPEETDEDAVEAPLVSEMISKYPEVIQRTYDRIQSVVNVFETGSTGGDYSDVTIYKDGGGGSYKQITYGRSQCTQDGTLDAVLKEYLDTADRTAAYEVIEKHYPTKGQLELVNNKELIQALKNAGREPVMRAAQDKIFDEKYFLPAYRWFTKNGFTLPLSMLVIYDSYIHSGGILNLLRRRFSEVPPVKGGDEKEWIKAYVKARRSWLANHSRTILHKTVYRMDAFNDAIDKNNWNLDLPVHANGVTV